MQNSPRWQCFARVHLCIYISYLHVDQIVAFIQKYSSKKAHGCDEVSAAMLQLSASEVAIHLLSFFRNVSFLALFQIRGRVLTSSPSTQETIAN